MIRHSDFAFITASNNDAILRSSLLASPELSEGARVLVQRGCHSAAKAYNDAIAASTEEFLIFLHQDIYLPSGWLQHTGRILEALNREDARWGVLGLYGMDCDGEGQGLLYSTGLRRILGTKFSGSRPVDTLDEVMLIMRRSSRLQFDEHLSGFHLYGADLCLQARSKGMKSYAMSNFCIHNACGIRILPWAYWKCYIQMRQKWRNELPVLTPCMTITRWNGAAMRYLVKTALLLALNRKKIGSRSADPHAVFEALCQRHPFTEFMNVL